jgi:nuclear protein localization family protein 4
MHKPDQKCQNCTAVMQFSYKMKYDCVSHKPFPLGMCNKCIPPSVVLNRQTYRHVDYVSIMNFQEMSGFVGYWQKGQMMTQRMGWLYGYYSEDPNYPEGVRVNVEAIYEPPQIGEMSGVQPLDDQKRYMVDAIAEALTLERVGMIFTKIATDTFLSSQEVRNIAKLQ